MRKSVIEQQDNLLWPLHKPTGTRTCTYAMHIHTPKINELTNLIKEKKKEKLAV